LNGRCGIYAAIHAGGGRCEKDSPLRGKKPCRVGKCHRFGAHSKIKRKVRIRRIEKRLLNIYAENLKFGGIVNQKAKRAIASRGIASGERALSAMRTVGFHHREDQAKIRKGPAQVRPAKKERGAQALPMLTDKRELRKRTVQRSNGQNRGGS